MALSINEANTVSSKYFDKSCTPQVYEKSPFFWRLKQDNNVVWDGGTKIQFGIRYTTLGKAQAVDPRQQIAYEQKETRTGAELAWKYYMAHAMLQWDERNQNRGKPQIINLMSDKADELREDMFNKMNTDLYATTQGAKTFQGIDEIVDSADTYAGISVSDAAAWAAIEDGTTDQLKLYGSGSLSYQINQSTFGSDKPTLIITTRDLQSKAESLLQPQERFEDKEMANAGFTTVKFHGIPIVGDYACTAQYMYGLCMKFFELRYHPDDNFKVSPWRELYQAGFPRALVKYQTWAGNLVCKCRKVNFKMTALDYTL